MKMPVLFAAAVALSACSTATPVDQSAETTPLTPLEAIDIAKAPTAAERGIEPAKAVTRTQNPVAEPVAAKAPAPSGDAVCNRGALDRGALDDETRSFILCEDGALRKAGVVAALSAPHDPELKLEDVSETYNVPTQVFIGIQSATYGSLVNGNRQAPRGGAKHKAQTGLVQIEGKIYEVYQLSSGGKTGTIFIEQKSGS